MARITLRESSCKDSCPFNCKPRWGFFGQPWIIAKLVIQCRGITYIICRLGEMANQNICLLFCSQSMFYYQHILNLCPSAASPVKNTTKHFGDNGRDGIKVVPGKCNHLIHLYMSCRLFMQ